MLTELSVVERRYLAVREALDGATPRGRGVLPTLA